MGKRHFNRGEEMALLIAHQNGTTYADLGRRQGCHASLVRRVVLRLRTSIGLPAPPRARPKPKPVVESTTACELPDCGKMSKGRSKYCSVQCRVKNAHRRSRGTPKGNA